MRMHAVLLTAVGLLLAADGPKKDAQQDLKKLEGTWVMVSGEKGGQECPPDVVKSARLVIKGNHHTVTVGDENFKGTHKLDPSQDPKAIDTVDVGGPFKGQTALGIYEVTDDEFKVCFAEPGNERPKKFTTKAGQAVFYHVWKREKE